MTTYPLPTLAAQVTPTGITAPTYEEIFLSLQASYRAIYGQDVYLEPDSQDGQWLAIHAAAINDSNAAAIAVYNSMSPATAKDAALSNNVKINGIRRLSPTNSTADLDIVGQAYLTILNGVAIDSLEQRWLLPASVVIPSGGMVTVTATAEQLGDIAAGAGTITTIGTPTRGWQSVTNVLAATPGAPVELDGELRVRQAQAVAISAITPTAAVASAVANLSGVTRSKAYENDTDAADGNGIPEHTICMVVEGGDAVEIATAIRLKKTAGTGTYGTTTETVNDSAGVPLAIHFFRPTIKNILAEIDITGLPGFVSPTEDVIKQAVADFINARTIGDDLYVFNVSSAAALDNGPLSSTFYVTSVRLAISPGSPSFGNIAIAFNEAPAITLAHITLTVT